MVGVNSSKATENLRALSDLFLHRLAGVQIVADNIATLVFVGAHLRLVQINIGRTGVDSMIVHAESKHVTGAVMVDDLLGFEDIPDVGSRLGRDRLLQALVTPADIRGSLFGSRRYIGVVDSPWLLGLRAAVEGLINCLLAFV